jgi:hypothetical protein
MRSLTAAFITGRNSDAPQSGYKKAAVHFGTAARHSLICGNAVEPSAPRKAICRTEA